jgi:hypothetical protein
MSNINLFLKRPTNPLISGLILQGTAAQQTGVTLLPHDGPYYMYAVIQGLLPADINKALGSPPPTISANMYAVDVSGKSVDVVQELEFLEVLGLAYNTDGSPTTWYVSPEAEPLYRLFKTSPTPVTRVQIMRPIVDLFQNVLLPGRLWRLWTTRIGLADTIEESVALDRQIRDIQEARADLAGILFR